MVKDIPVQKAQSSASTPESENDETPPSKRKKTEKSTQIQTACMYCRGSKMKCIRNTEEEDCKRCVAAGIKCETHARKSGRKPGQGTKRHYQKINEASTEDKASNDESNVYQSLLQEASAMSLPFGQNQVIQGLEDNYQGHQTSYADVQNTLQTRMAYEQQQSYMLSETSAHTHLNNNEQSGFNMLSQPVNGHHVLFDDSQNTVVQSQTTAPTDSMLDGVRQQNHFAMPNYSSSSTFNTNFSLPLSTALPALPNHLFLPSFAALTSGGSTVQTNVSNFPPVPSTSSESNSIALTNVLQGSSKGSGESHQSSGWTPVSHTQEGGSHASLTITPLDMLATLGMKNSKLASARSDAAGESVVLPREVGKLTMRSSSSYASRAYLAKTTTQAEYFAANHPFATLDWEPGNDPVELSLVTESEARQIIDYYFAHCNPLNPLLDPGYHSFDRLTTTSTFLLTAMLSIGAKFMDQHAAVAQRLYYHLQKTLIPNAIMEGNSSLELVEGFMVLAPYADAGRHLTLELTGTYLAVAHDRFKRLPRPRMALDKEARLYRRSYERLHLILFAYERGFALISGQSLGYLIPEPELASSLLQWARQDAATPADWDIAALCALRHAIPDILRIIAPSRSNEKDTSQTKMASPAILKAVLAEMLSDWRSTWFSGITARAYLTIVEGHTSLSLWINALRGHVGQPTETAILQQALLAAIQTLQAVVGADEFSLRFLVNNTFVMVAYAAAFTLRLLARWTETSAPVEGSISLLISQVADRLQVAGRTPEHRYGRSWLYGQRLHEMLKDRMASRRPSRAPSPFAGANVMNGAASDHAGVLAGEKPNDGVSHPLPSKEIQQELVEQQYDIANMSPDKVDKLLSEYTWFPLENTGTANELLDWEAFFAT